MKTLRPYRVRKFAHGTILVVLTALFSLPNLRAGDLSSGFDAANKLYEQSRFSDAAAAYDKLIATGNVSEALYFNRGNAFFKLGQIGRAVASYRQAQRLAPRDKELQTNLQLARTRARGGQTYQPERWRVLLGKLTLNEWTILLMLAFWAWFILLTLAQWRPGLKPLLSNYTWGAGIAVLLIGVCFTFVYNNDYLTSTAVVITGEADIRNGPLDESPSLFKVRDGIELTVLDQKNDWLQVADSVQRTGWIRRDQTLVPSHSQKPGS